MTNTGAFLGRSVFDPAVHLDQAFAGIDVVLIADGDLLHHRRAAAVQAAHLGLSLIHIFYLFYL